MLWRIRIRSGNGRIEFVEDGGVGIVLVMAVVRLVVFGGWMWVSGLSAPLLARGGGAWTRTAS